MKTRGIPSLNLQEMLQVPPESRDDRALENMTPTGEFVRDPSQTVRQLYMKQSEEFRVVEIEGLSRYHNYWITQRQEGETKLYRARISDHENP